MADQNVTLVAQGKELKIRNGDLITEKGKAEAANLTNRSLTLANQSLSSTGEIEDRLLLARAAISFTTTLPATTALLTALDEGYRTPFDHHERLDSAGGGPWERIAFSGDGHTLALGDRNGGIRLWDNVTGEPIGAAPARGTGQTGSRV